MGKNGGKGEWVWSAKGKWKINSKNRSWFLGETKDLR